MSKELEVNAPKVIYLQIGDDHEGEYSDEATWCADKIHNTDIAYVLRSDCDELAKDMSAQATALYDLLTAKLTEAERRNKVALEAMKEASSCAYNEAPAYITGPILEKAITELELK